MIVPTSGRNVAIEGLAFPENSRAESNTFGEEDMMHNSLIRLGVYSATVL